MTTFPTLQEEEVPSPNSLLFAAEEPIVTDLDMALGADMGVLQSLDMEYTEEIYQNIRDARQYLQDVVMTEPKYQKVRGNCQNAHESCTYWAVLGECDNNPGKYLSFCISIACPQFWNVPTHPDIFFGFCFRIHDGSLRSGVSIL
jgi:hypothetical protein